jgi:hypothetical protein
MLRLSEVPKPRDLPLKQSKGFICEVESQCIELLTKSTYEWQWKSWRVN